MLDLALEVEDAPRHLGIHSGGMVICDRPVIEVCPVEWGRMDKRSVLQWDKDDCAATGLVKFDLLGLGMLSALHAAIDLVREHRGYEIDLATLPQDDDVYAMLCRADTVGVFQVESRAQMATLPRLKPRRFYDLVVEVALIRPGPIQGGSVHPYIRRRNGKEQVTYLHPLLENSLGKTLGIPLFQEQLMQMAIDVAGFTPAESDELRQAMGSKRSARRMEQLKERLYVGMEGNGITGDIADELYQKMKAFANYGFPESHSVSFAYLVYSSSWIKYHEPAAFCAALLNAQPMGFWSPHTLVRDARRHGVVVRTPDLNASLANAATLEPCEEDGPGASVGGVAVRLGLGSIRGIGADAGRLRSSPSASGVASSGDTEDLVRRVPALQLPQLEAMSAAGVFTECFGLGRREAMWTVGSHRAVAPGTTWRASSPVTQRTTSARDDAGRRSGGRSLGRRRVAGWAPDSVLSARNSTRSGCSPRRNCGIPNPARWCMLRAWSPIVSGRRLGRASRSSTSKTRPGLINVVVSKGCWQRFRNVAREASAMVIRGRLERSEGVINIVAERLDPLPMSGAIASRDFR